MATATLIDRESAPQADELVAVDEFGDPCEVVDGQAVEGSSMGAWEGCVATTIAFLLNQFVREKRLGRVAGEVLFILKKEPRLHRKPDVAFVSAERSAAMRPTARTAAWDVIPDLAIEVVSPTDPAGAVQAKIVEYFAAGVRLVWIVYPDQCQVYVYESPRVVRVLGWEDTVDGGSVLPGFTMALAEVFEAEVDEAPPARSDEP